jgi:putative transposase
MTETLVGVSPPSSKDSADPPSAEELAAATGGPASKGRVDRSGRVVESTDQTVLETTWEEEMAEHLGYDSHDPTGRNRGNVWSGIRMTRLVIRTGEPLQRGR